MRIIVAQERSTRGGPDYLPLLRRELLEVIKKYVNVDPEAVQVNLEREDGELIEGARENADFWRWFLPYLRGEEETGWVPTGPAPAATQPTTTQPAPADIFSLPVRTTAPSSQVTTPGGK